jgi:hypothetical protein
VSAARPIGDELALLSLAVAAARAQVANRRPVDMAVFAVRLEALCRRIGAEPRPEMARLAPDLVKLRDELDLLAVDIREMVEALSAQAHGGEMDHPPSEGGPAPGAHG